MRQPGPGIHGGAGFAQLMANRQSLFIDKYSLVQLAEGHQRMALTRQRIGLIVEPAALLSIAERLLSVFVGRTIFMLMVTE